MPQVEFVVKASLHKNEYIAITGSSDEIGKWNIERSITLNLVSNNLWKKTIEFKPGKICYKFFVGVTSKHSEGQIINRYENHPKESMHTIDVKTKDLVIENEFGNVQNVTSIDKGWLTQQSEIRFNFSLEKESAPVIAFNSSLENLKLESLFISCEFSDAVLGYATIIKPFEFINKECNEKILIPTNTSMFLSFIIQILHRKDLDLTFKIFSDNVLIGQCFVIGSMLDADIGNLNIPIISSDQAVIGKIHFKYIVIEPFKMQPLTMEQTLSRSWDETKTLEVGHRGCGNSFTCENISNIYENTIESFNKAAESNCDMVEFDVHLTKDKVPIVYHDLTFAVGFENLKNDISLLEVQTKSLNLDELQKIKTYHLSRIKSNRQLEFDMFHNNVCCRPFPTLKDVLCNVSENIGFNVEVKWPSFDINSKWESGVDNYFNPNEFVDQIIDVVLSHAGNRKIHFSCFDINICIMLRRKQTRYPVNFLTNGESGHYTPLMDIRERFNSLAVGVALFEGFLALNTLENDVYNDNTFVKKVKDTGLRLVLYGDNISRAENRSLLKRLGVDAIIYDSIHKVGLST